ncbi:hypothetical protein Drorol1_Dr00014837 [Drosera rotundifolia]
MVVITCPETLEGQIHLIEAVTVLKLDMEKRAWVKGKNIHDHMIFLGFNCSVSCSSPDTRGAEKNYLYFTEEEDPSVYCYRMEDKSLTATLPREKKLRDPWHRSTWVLPHHRLTQQPQGQTKEKLKHMSKKREEIVHDSPSETLITDLREKVPLEFETTLQSQLCKLPRTVIESLARNLNIIDYLMSWG